MKIIIDFEERYPVYYFVKDLRSTVKEYGVIVDVPEELIEQFENVEKEYNWLQEQLEQLYEQNK